MPEERRFFLEGTQVKYQVDVEKIYNRLSFYEANINTIHWSRELTVTSWFYGTQNYPFGLEEEMKFELDIGEKKAFYIDESVLDYYTQILYFIRELAWPNRLELHEFSREELLETFADKMSMMIDIYELAKQREIEFGRGRPMQINVKDWIRTFPEKIESFLEDYCKTVVKYPKLYLNDVKPIEVTKSDKSSRYISEKVKDAVWNRDGGKCVHCGSNEKLEFDHIIPHSKGGSNTKRNIQLLCEICNRQKSDKIG